LKASGVDLDVVFFGQFGQLLGLLEILPQRPFNVDILASLQSWRNCRVMTVNADSADYEINIFVVGKVCNNNQPQHPERYGESMP